MGRTSDKLVSEYKSATGRQELNSAEIGFFIAIGNEFDECLEAFAKMTKAFSEKTQELERRVVRVENTTRRPFAYQDLEENR